MTLLKKWLPDMLAVLLFAVLAFAYFFPADIEGRILYRHDASAGRGAGQEGIEYMQKTGERSRWTNALFGGMPTYQMAPSYHSTDKLSTMTKIYHLFLPENVWYVFAYLLGFYILLRAFDFRQHLAALGSIVWAFSTYFLIIIAAGHIWKVWALAYLPPLIAGLVLAYRGKYLWGFVLTAIFTAFEINANHVQMTYYYLFIILAMVIAWLVDAIRKHQLAAFGKATAVCIAGAAIGVCINLSNLYHTWQYGQESMRGKSELVKKNSANQTSSGLERDYITQWSYGIDETWTLLIPNTKGGASVPMSESKIAMEKADPTYESIYQQIGQYWGEQPGTSGPVYVGAFVMFLFVLGLLIVKGPMKWALLAVTILSILLSWGRNFMGFTDFFLDYVPMYAKFRTVASILVIAEFTIPLLAMMALKKLFDEPEGFSKYSKPIYISFGVTAGFCLLFALMPTTFFDGFVSSSEMRALSTLPQEHIQPLISNLVDMRTAVFTADCWRSFWIIVVGMVLLMAYKYRKLKAEYTIGAILVLCLIDLWQVNKRYLNDEMFVPQSEREAPQQMSQTDELILRDKALDYRVLNLASNTFNENETSYYHKSIGGYHAAKLRRYQEMIEQYISPEMQRLMNAVAEAGGDMTQVKGDSICPVINMLNTRYFVFPLQGGQTVPIQNPYALGNAWFVDKISYAKNANEEILKVGQIDLRHEAVADEKFQAQLGDAVAQDTTSTVDIKSYEPNQLTYEVNSGKGGVVVFSEVYYPGWTATIDGEPAELGRVNYILRALNVKPGKHEVVLSFFPKSVDTTETIAYTAYAILLLVLAGAAFMAYRRKKNG
ncbi:membrane protein [Xylanibacter ruminicola]|uniref:Membrane protein n=2 Tax=Xylanibacter ruminicola TaxID=839 RepID=D5EVJ4_XYLR2|nr:YfhO family protein [Xylanibacter ruminicola]ADE81237.1 putative membrane protein [Xylanibacter ruminicola 23]GJG32538.1 membrane protein [Xylanibacter ruminicola]SEH93794.1 membrane protein YfhO [Xylanibacter ruminicola]